MTDYSKTHPTTSAITNKKAVRDAMPGARTPAHRGKTTTVTTETFALMIDEFGAATVSLGELAQEANVPISFVNRMARATCVRPTPERALKVIDYARDVLDDAALERLGLDRPTQYDLLDPSVATATKTDTNLK